MRAALDEMVVSAFHQNAQVKKGFSLESTSPQKKKKKKKSKLPINHLSQLRKSESFVDQVT